MNNKMNTFDQGLNYLNQVPKEEGVFAPRNLEAIPWVLFLFKSLGKLMKGKVKAKEVINFAGRKMRQYPWIMLASVGTLAFLTGMASRKILVAKQKI